LWLLPGLLRKTPPEGHLATVQNTPPVSGWTALDLRIRRALRLRQQNESKDTAKSQRRRPGMTAAQQKVNDIFLHGWISKVEDKLELLETMVFSLLLTSSWKVSLTWPQRGSVAGVLPRLSPCGSQCASHLHPPLAGRTFTFA
jgi:hypothetical protein